MKAAYIYVRVSTDEQKNRGFSLIEQEDRLLKYCECHQVKVLGIFREDYSAKTFDRPEWVRLLKSIRKDKERPQVYILFLKWDRFSRNTEYSYQMLGLLRSLNVRAMAIDQQCDPNIPENKVVLAMFLSMPEAENIRRGKNTSDGMRRARLEGRWPNGAPTGYVNQTAPDGKKIIVPKYPEAEHIKWAFQQFAKGSYTVSQIRKAIFLKGFKCAKSSFFRILRNPAYCGIVTVSACENENPQFVKGIHEPLVSEELFQMVQVLLKSKRRQKHVFESKKHLFPLRGFLKCPYCNRRLTGSTSRGRNTNYRYYHCVTGCPG